MRKVRQLYAMLDGTGCRAAAVRRYFGEAGVSSCGQCDLCLNPPEAVDATEAAQKALSAVHRLGGRFGRGRIVDHLTGKTKDAPAARGAAVDLRHRPRIQPRRLARPARPAAVRRPAARGPQRRPAAGRAGRRRRGQGRLSRRAAGVGAPGARRCGDRCKRPLGALAQAPRRRAARHRSGRRAAVRGPAGLAPRARGRAARAALRHLPRRYALGHRAPATGQRRTPWRRSAASARSKLERYGADVLKIVRDT